MNLIQNCGCTATERGVKLGASYQDARYGTGMRVHTPMKLEDKYRCTICLKERTVESAKKRKQREKEEAEAKANKEKSGGKLAKVKS